MSAVAYFIAFILTAIATPLTLAAIVAPTQDESINLYGYLLLVGSLLLAILTGIGITTVLGLYLFNTLLIGGLLFTAALFKRSAEEDVPVRQLIRQLWAEIRTQHSSPPVQDTDTDKPVDEITIFEDQ